MVHRKQLCQVRKRGVRDELIGGAQLGEGPARRLLGGLAYRSEKLDETLASRGSSLVTERSRQQGARQQAEIAFSTPKHVFGIEHTLAKTLVGLATRIVAKICAYTYGFYVNRLLGRPQGRIKALWARDPRNTLLGLSGSGSGALGRGGCPGLRVLRSRPAAFRLPDGALPPD
jgi:hypothetical protein